MAYLSRERLESMGFRALGRDVRISDRAAIHDAERISIGDYARVDDFCSLSGTLTLGRNTLLAVYSHIAGGRPGVVLEDFATLAYGCHVFAQSDDYSGATMANPTVPAAYKREIEGKVHIGRHCILGAGTAVMPGVTIGEGTAVGAMSLVTRDAEPWSIYFGVPAKRRKARSRDLLALEKAYLAEDEAR